MAQDKPTSRCSGEKEYHGRKYYEAVKLLSLYHVPRTPGIYEKTVEVIQLTAYTQGPLRIVAIKSGGDGDGREGKKYKPLA